MHNPSPKPASYQTRPQQARNSGQLAWVTWLFVIPLLSFAETYEQQTPGFGCWWRPELKSAGSPQVCDFLIEKRAVFSKTGHVRWIEEKSKEAPPPAVWVTHRLSPGEWISPSAGQKLGQQLASKVSKNTPWIELDIEPMGETPGWFAEFHKNLKKELGPVRVHYAVPFLKCNESTGRSWTSTELVKLLLSADGIDLMFYDTGMKTPEGYLNCFKENLNFAAGYLKDNPDKQIVFGLPTYPDRTRLHLPKIENLKTLKPAFESSAICQPRLAFAVYAGWTMSKAEVVDLSELKDVAKRTCQAVR